MIDALELMVAKLNKWHALRADDRRALLDLPFERKMIRSQAYIVHEGDRPTRACVLLDGYAYRQKTTRNGSRQILAVHLPGDWVDLQNAFLKVADHSVQALGRIEIASVPQDAISALAFERPAIGRALWHDTLVDASIAREWTTNVGQRDARARIAHLLCEFALRLKAANQGARTDFEIPLTQDQLADATGLTPVHVNRCLRWMDGLGIIVRAHRSLKIVDWAALAKLGEFDNAYLH